LVEESPGVEVPSGGPVTALQEIVQPTDAVDQSTVPKLMSDTELAIDEQQQEPPTPRTADPELIAERIWSYVEIGDLAAAFWLARAIEDTESAPLIDSSLLEILQALKWDLLPPHPLAGTAKVPRAESFVSDATRDQSPAFCLLRYAAAVESRLFGWDLVPDAWLDCSGDYTPLRDLAEESRQLYTMVGPLSNDVTSKVANIKEKQNKVTLSSQGLRDWLRDVQERFTLKELFDKMTRNNPFSASTMAQILSRKCEFGSAAQAVIDDTGNPPQIRIVAERWLSGSHFEEQFNQIRERLSAGEFRHLPVHDVRAHFHRPISDGCHLLLEWCQAAEARHQAQQSPEQGFVEHISRQMAGTEAALESGLAFASKMQADAQLRLPERAAYSGLVKALQHLKCRIQPSRADDISQTEPQPWEIEGARSIEDALSRRLMWYPQLQFHDEDGLKPSQWSTITTALNGLPLDEQQRRLGFEALIASGKLRIARVLLGAFSGDCLLEMNAAWLEAKKREQAEISQRATNLLQDVQHFAREGVIDEEVGDLYTSLLNELSASPDSSRNEAESTFQDVTDHLSIARRTVFEGLNARWQRIHAKVVESNDLAPVTVSALQQIVEEQMQRNELRNAEETLSQISQIIDEGVDIDKRFRMFTEALANPGRDEFAEFIKAHSLLERRLKEAAGIATILHDLRDDNVDPELGISEDAAVHEELVRALESWMALKRYAPEQAALQLTREHVHELLDYLGFRRLTGVGQGDKNDVMLAGYSALDRSPLAELGSLAEGKYRAKLVWGRASIGQIASLLAAADWPHLVFYLGALGLPARYQLAQQCRAESRSTLIIDEVLLLFLARMSAPRVRSLFLVAAPFSGINPYSDVEGKSVSPEVFVGRSRQILQISTERKNRLLFGGRQLGKSALLGEVYRRLKSEAADVIVVLKVVREMAPDWIWGELDRELRASRLISDSHPASKADTVAFRIREAYRKGESRRVLVLLDEVEDFLNSEAVGGEKNLGPLLQLTNYPDMRDCFNVVLSGNYHTQRFARANAAVERFTPMVVGPLDYSDAVNLVRNPLEAIGFRFDQSVSGIPDAIQRIIHYTFCHAGLMQLFLHDLVAYLREYRDVSPPCYIRTDDIDQFAGANHRLVFRRMKKRFVQTTGANHEYGLILLSLILDQPDEDLDHFYSARQILDLLGNNWPNGVDAIKAAESIRSADRLDRWIEGVLEEMVGLGLLVKNYKGHYRVRSRSLLRLYGEREGVLEELALLKSKPPMPEGPLDHRHEPPSDEFPFFSPFCGSERRELRTSKLSVRIVIGSRASGMDYFPQALDRLLARSRESKAIFQACDRPQFSFIEWLANFLQDAEPSRQYLVTVQVPLGAQVEDWRTTAARMVRDSASRRDVGITFLLKPMPALEWLRWRHVNNLQAPPEDTMIVTLRKWSRLALDCALADLGRSPDISDRVLQITAGWPLLVEEVLNRLGRVEEVGELLTAIEQDLNSSGNVAVRFQKSLEIEELPLALHALEQLCHDDPTLFEQWDQGEIASLRGSEPSERRAVLDLLEQLGYVHLDDAREFLTPDPAIKRALGS
jgi:hypothetical protein